jgi:hypothetical protein
VQVRVQVNGVTKRHTWTGLPGVRLRPDVGAAYPGAGNNHGWELAVPLDPGSNTVCAYAMDIPGPAGPGQLGPCATVTVP